MATMTYEEYLPLRGNIIDPDKLIPGYTYYIEENKPQERRTVYKGIYSHDMTDLAIFNNIDNEPYSWPIFFVNPLGRDIRKRTFRKDPNRFLFYNDPNDPITVNKNVRRLVYTLTGKRKNMIGPIPRGHTREMGLPIDVATIMAIDLEDTLGISKTAKKINSRNTSQSASKGGKKRTKKQRTKKH
jgi:hypothetical protein